MWLKVVEFLAQNWAWFSLIVSMFFCSFFAGEFAEILLIPFKVVWFVLSKFFGLFKKPVSALKQAKRLKNT